ncbi:MAG: transcriptional regulator GcvA [Nevskia sp.]|nr:transcriptional regulator GcvA [Nevskia sp.]
MAFSKLPPLNALRAFEAVARHKSFRKAAEELFVTPAALTHQIKSLEEQLGFQLFERLQRRIELTPAAQAALPRFQEGFRALSQAVFELRNYGKAPHLTVGATPTFVSRWLMPRLQRFLTEHPGIDVRLVASGQLINASSREIRSEDPTDVSPDTDIDIRFSNGRPAGDNVDLLFMVEVVPMCHPRLLKGPPPLETPDDLRHQTLLHGDARVADRTKSAWARWLRLAGITDVDPRRGLQLDHSTLALEAAADGLGVTLAMPLLADAELSEGKVVVAFPLPLSLDNAYYAVVADTSMARPEVAAFRRWLVQEASARPAASDPSG